MLGAELGGAMKNVLAVATGVADGMQLGLNARAGLITRGLNEMLRLNQAIGGQPETLMGLAGLGDLVLTCTGDLSRNRRLGLALGRGQSIADAVREIGQVVESVQTADEVMRQADAHGIELPISSAVQRVLHGEITPAEGLRQLLAREQKPEYPQRPVRLSLAPRDATQKKPGRSRAFSLQRDCDGSEAGAHADHVLGGVVAGSISPTRPQVGLNLNWPPSVPPKLAVEVAAVEVAGLDPAFEAVGQQAAHADRDAAAVESSVGAEAVDLDIDLAQVAELGDQVGVIAQPWW